MFNWLTQGVVSSIIAAVLVAGAGIVIGYFKQKGAAWVTPVMYGLGSASLVAAIVLAALAFQAIPPSKPRVTAENVESNIKAWADDMGLGLTRPSSQPPDTFFAYTITAPSGNPIMVFRGKNKSRNLQVQTVLALSAEHQAALSKLNKEQAADVLQEIILDLDRARISWTMVTAAPLIPGTQLVPFTPQVELTVMKAVPIDGLDEDGFFRAVDEVDQGISLVRASTELALHRASLESAAK